MKKITFKRNILPLSIFIILSQGLINNAFAEQTSVDGKEIIGDKYWHNKTTEEYDEVKATRFNINNISASNVEKTLKANSESKINSIRLEMLQQAALSFGTQAGLAKGGLIINKALDQFNGNDKKLDKVYDFEKIQLEPGFLPPVITEGRNAYNQPSADEVRAADTIYKIEFPARIVNAAPNWRNYLYVEINEPETPAKSTLPKTSAENKVWDEWVKKGWDQGYEQAIDLFESELSRLDRDFKGMLRYKRLYQLGMVTKPKISKTELGVTGGGNEMAVGDRVIKKTYDSELNPKTNKWFK